MILTWDIFEIRCDCEVLHGVKLRGRIRKFTLEHSTSCLVENASDEGNVVRFALLADSSAEAVSKFVKSILPEATITDSMKSVPNPVLSKLKVTDSTRYGSNGD